MPKSMDVLKIYIQTLVLLIEVAIYRSRRRHIEMCANRESFTLINPVCAVQLQESEGPAAPSTFFIVKWCGNWRILINIHYFDNYPLQWLQMNWTKAWDTSVNTSRCGLNPHFAGCGEFTVDSVEKVMGIIAMDRGLGVQELNVFLRVIFSKSKFQTKHWQTWGPNSRAMRWLRKGGRGNRGERGDWVE